MPRPPAGKRRAPAVRCQPDAQECLITCLRTTTIYRNLNNRHLKQGKTRNCHTTNYNETLEPGMGTQAARRSPRTRPGAQGRLTIDVRNLKQNASDHNGQHFPVGRQPLRVAGTRFAQADHSPLRGHENNDKIITWHSSHPQTHA